MSAVSGSRLPIPELRCAPQADRRGDPMLGTAFPAARLLLVEQPHPWGFEGLRDSRFDRDTALALEARGRAEGVRVQAIRRIGRREEPARRRWALLDTRDAEPQLRWGDFDADDELLALPWNAQTGEPSTEPAYLVCTHARHDPCCGQRGRRLSAALAAQRPAQVWQSSHLGGCRFAPTVLVLPLGVVLGRVDPERAEEVVAATEAGHVLPEFLRGRIGMPPVAQAACAYVSAQLGITAARGVGYRHSAIVEPGRARVRVATGSGEFDVTVELTRTDAAGLTCAHPGATWFLAHHPLSMVAVPGP